MSLDQDYTLRYTRQMSKISQDKKTGKFLPSHGRKKHYLYQTWINMLRRCDSPKRWDYKYYGARGITVCEEWKDIESFIQWANLNGWKKELTLDRIDNDGNYEPDNCQWIPFKENIRKNTHTKLDFEIAEQIRAECKKRSYVEYERLATKFNLSRTTIIRVILSYSWTD